MIQTWIVFIHNMPLQYFLELLHREGLALFNLCAFLAVRKHFLSRVKCVNGRDRIGVQSVMRIDDEGLIRRIVPVEPEVYRSNNHC